MYIAVMFHVQRFEPHTCTVTEGLGALEIHYYYDYYDYYDYYYYYYYYFIFCPDVDRSGCLYIQNTELLVVFTFVEVAFCASHVRSYKS